jgi:non-ribosomal peptide synthetase component F
MQLAGARGVFRCAAGRSLVAHGPSLAQGLGHVRTHAHAHTHAHTHAHAHSRRGGEPPSGLSPNPAESHVVGASTPPLVHTTLGRHLDSVASVHAGREALVVAHQAVRWTYGEMMQRADRLAAGFLAQGLAPGDRVGIWAPNCSEWCVVVQVGGKSEGGGGRGEAEGGKGRCLPGL